MTTLPFTQLISRFRKGKILFCKNKNALNKMLSETNISKMLEFLIDNIFVMFGVCVFQQTAGIPMDTKCAPPLSNLFLLFIQGRKKVA